MQNTYTIIDTPKTEKQEYLNQNEQQNNDRNTTHPK